MDLALLDIVPRFHEDLTHDVTGENDPLSPNPCNQHIRGLMIHRLLSSSSRIGKLPVLNGGASRKGPSL
jgi:hypothetical protein